MCGLQASDLVCKFTMSTAVIYTNNFFVMFLFVCLLLSFYKHYSHAAYIKNFEQVTKTHTHYTYNTYTHAHTHAHTMLLLKIGARGDYTSTPKIFLTHL